MQNEHKYSLEVVTGVSHFLAEFQRHSLRRKILVGCEVGSSWRPLGARWVKINFDGAVFMDGVEGGCSIMAHSKFGECVAWVAYRFVQPVFPRLVQPWLLGKLSLSFFVWAGVLLSLKEIVSLLFTNYNLIVWISLLLVLLFEISNLLNLASLAFFL
ncbi:UNVERIFIED_CONTAM: hypothetical protein Sradi_1289800 [Sesamum radiatum]|uniref:Uncharacterized protein n=1 Tax=Sesamum radiatum TaxID=300843 RepID=A0AAW2UPE8_SESRA